MEKGLIHIYTGEGKGKTTAAIGLAVRALAHHFKVSYVHFHKQPEKYGNTEIHILIQLGARTYGIAESHPFFDRSIKPEEYSEKVQQGFNNLIRWVKKENFDLLILDEVIVSVHDGFLPEQRLIEFIDQKPAGLELIMTGRGASDNLIEKADYVANVSKVKHPFDKNISAREGIEY